MDETDRQSQIEASSRERRWAAVLDSCRMKVQERASGAGEILILGALMPEKWKPRFPCRSAGSSFQVALPSGAGFLSCCRRLAVPAGLGWGKAWHKVGLSLVVLLLRGAPLGAGQWEEGWAPADAASTQSLATEGTCFCASVNASCPSTPITTRSLR